MFHVTYNRSGNNQRYWVLVPNQDAVLRAEHPTLVCRREFLVLMIWVLPAQQKLEKGMRKVQRECGI